MIHETSHQESMTQAFKDYSIWVGVTNQGTIGYEVHGDLSTDDYGDYQVKGIIIRPWEASKIKDTVHAMFNKLKNNAPKIIEMLKEINDL